MHVAVCVSPDNAIYMMLLLHPLSLNPGEMAVISLMVWFPAFIIMTKTRGIFSCGHESTEGLLSHFQNAYFLETIDFSTHSFCISEPRSYNINCIVAHLPMQMWPLGVCLWMNGNVCKMKTITNSS